MKKLQQTTTINDLSIIGEKKVILLLPIYMYNNFVMIIDVIINTINLKLNDYICQSV